MKLNEIMIHLLITIVVSAISGYIGLKLKLPVGALLGAMFGVAFFNLFTGIVYMPSVAKIYVQMIAGTFLGLGVKKENLRDIKSLIRPTLIIVTALFIMNITMGFILPAISGMTLRTALLSSAPGGVMDTTMISEGLGADQSIVAIMQLTRLLTVVGFFPLYFRYMQSRFDKVRTDSINAETNMPKVKASAKGRELDIIITLLIAFVGGTIGNWVKFPAGALAFAMFAVAAYNIKTGKAFLPMYFKRIAQVFAGAVLGVGIDMMVVLKLKTLVLPAVIMMAAYLLTCTIVTFLITSKKNCPIDFTTTMFASSPGGISDLALIAMDMGGDSPQIAILQLGRMIAVVSVFPILYNMLANFLGV